MSLGVPVMSRPCDAQCFSAPPRGRPENLQAARRGHGVQGIPGPLRQPKGAAVIGLAPPGRLNGSAGDAGDHLVRYGTLPSAVVDGPRGVAAGAVGA